MKVICHFNNIGNQSDTLSLSESMLLNLESSSPFRFRSSFGVILYGLVRNPLDGTYHAFQSLGHFEKYRSKFEAQDIGDDDEWHSPHAPGKRAKTPIVTVDEPRPFVIFYYNKLETNRRRH